MAPKRLKKSRTNVDNSDKYKNLSISDVLCPICRSILIKPATLPCNHSFCLTCFNDTVENAALTCPLCRTRIGSWIRLARKENKVVDDILWKIIQTKFSNQIRKKLDGEDVLTDDDNSQVKIKLADPGDIRREYELELESARSEIQKDRDNEEKASEIIIQKILQEEEHAAKIEKEKLQLDEDIAKRLAAEDTVVPTVSQKSATKSSPKKSAIDKYLIALSKKKQDVRPTVSANKNGQSEVNSSTNVIDSSQRKSSVKTYSSKILSQSRSKLQCSKAFQHILLTKTLQCKRADSNGSDSGDSIKQEMRYFKPIRLAPSADKYKEGKLVHTPLLKLPTVHAKTNLIAVIRSPKVSKSTVISSHLKSAFVSLSPTPRSVPSISVPPVIVPVPSIIMDGGKVIKQYYNKKRNAAYAAATQLCTITSSPESPCLGFETQNKRNITVINDFIKKLSQYVNGVMVHADDNKIVENEAIKGNFPDNETQSFKETIITKNNEQPLKNINGYKPEMIEPSSRLKSSDNNLQEQLDFEFARRLHEELNNPRQTRGSLSTKTTTVKTRTGQRKRQVTLDEIMSPKKFKI